MSPPTFMRQAYLVGEYDSPYQRDRAVMLAGSVSGVKSVAAYLLPKTKDERCGPADNTRINSEVKAKILRTADLVHERRCQIRPVQCRSSGRRRLPKANRKGRRPCLQYIWCQKGQEFSDFSPGRENTCCEKVGICNSGSFLTAKPSGGLFHGQGIPQPDSLSGDSENSPGR